MEDHAETAFDTKKAGYAKKVGHIAKTYVVYVTDGTNGIADF